VYYGDEEETLVDTLDGRSLFETFPTLLLAILGCFLIYIMELRDEIRQLREEIRLLREENRVLRQQLQQLQNHVRLHFYSLLHFRMSSRMLN